MKIVVQRGGGANNYRRGLVITFLVLTALFTAAIWWDGRQQAQYTTEYRRHTVSAGQTLWGIATKYFYEQDKTRDIREIVYDIRAENRIGYNEAIQPGQVLIVPLGKKISR